MKDGPQMPRISKSSRRLTFVVAYISLFAFSFVFQSLPPILKLISDDFKLEYAQAGLLMGVFVLIGIVSTIPGGWLADRYGFRPIGLIAAGTMTIGALFTIIADSFGGLVIGRLISGFGATVLVVIAAGLVSRTFRDGGLGIAMGFYNTGLPLATIISFNILGVIGANLGWRRALIVPAVVAAVALVLIAYRPEESPIRKKDGALGLKQSLLAADRRIWYIGISWFWFNAAGISFLTFAPEYFTDLKYSPETAAFIAGLVMWGALIVSPIIGLFMGGPRRQELLIITGSVLPAIIYFVLPMFRFWQLPLVVVLGLTVALVPAPLFALSAKLVGREQHGTVFGILATCLNIGVLFGPYSVGLTRDITGSFRLGFAVMSVFSILAGVSILPLFLIRRHENLIHRLV